VPDVKVARESPLQYIRRMRLRDIRRLLDANVEQIQAKFDAVNNQHVDFTNRASAREALIAIREVPFLSSTVEGILNDPVFKGDSSLTPSGNHGPIQSAIQCLQTDAKSILGFLWTQVPKDPDGFFTVSFSDSDSSASIVAKRFDSLHRAFEQPVSRVFGEALLVTLVEPGSILVELGVYLHAAGTAAGVAVSINQILSFVGKLLTLGIEKSKLDQERAKALQELEKVRQENAKAGQEEAKTEQLRLALRQAETATKIAELKAELLALQIEKSATELSGPSKDPNDAAPILRNAIVEIAEMYSARARFMLQLGAPEEVRNNFPPEALPEGKEPQHLREREVKRLLAK